MASESTGAKAQLSVLNGRSKGATLEMSQRREYTVGRSGNTDLQLRDPPVSRVHCKIEFDGDYFWLIDNGSANGTLVNEQRVQRYMLYDGDTITLGKTDIQFRITEPPEEKSNAQIPMEPQG